MFGYHSQESGKPKGDPFVPDRVVPESPKRSSEVVSSSPTTRVGVFRINVTVKGGERSITVRKIY